MAEYVNYLRVFGAPGAARALFGAIQDDTAGLGDVYKRQPLEKRPPQTGFTQSIYIHREAAGKTG